MLGQPVTEEGVRHANLQRTPVITHESRGFEPGVEDVPVDFRLYAGKDLVPDTAGHVRAPVGFNPLLFHIFFHSCGKLRGEPLRGPQGTPTVAHAFGADNRAQLARIRLTVLDQLRYYRGFSAF